MRWLILVVCFFVYGVAHAEPEPSILNPSGLPVPRFVSLKSDDVNVRVGPGKRYPIKWHYARNRLPVEIIEEFAHWRKIRDFEGTTGWVHKGIVDGKRTILILGKETQQLYVRPDPSSSVSMRVAPGVIAFLKACSPDWCRVEIQDRKAWIRKTDIWGITREETFDE